MRSLWVLALPLVLCAHAVVSPGTSRPGAYERYVLRVPNEGDVATVRVEMTFPSEVRVISFVDVPGWTIRAEFDSTGRATRAVWTGSLPPERFVELPFMGVNPRSGTITWPAIQTYANGVRAEWTGPPGSDSPASVTVISAPARTDGTGAVPTALAGLALLVSVVALVVAVRRRVAT